MPALGCKRMLNKILRETEVNEFLQSCTDTEPFEFVDQVLDYFDCSYRALGREIERIPTEGPLVIVVGRVLGLLECAALLKLVGQVRRDLRVVTNDVLMSFRPLRPLLLPPAAIGGA